MAPQIVSKNRKFFAIEDRLADSPLHFLGFAAQHRRLVRDPDRFQVNIRIEPRRMCVLEMFEKRLFVAAVADVIADIIGILERQDDEIMSLAVTEGAGTGRLRLFVLGLAVNDRGRRFAGVFADPLPDAHHVAAGSVHDLAAAILDLLLNGKFGAESGDDDNIVGLQIGDVGLFVVAGQVLDAERRDLLVDLGIVNDFTNNEEPTVLENFARGVSKIDGAFDPVAKPKLLRQAHRDVAAAQNPAGAPDLVHDVAAIMRFDLLLHGRHHFRRAQVHLLARRRSAGDKIGAHRAE